MIIEVDDDILEHYGVKGMRWGKRGTRRVQKRIDRTQRVASGTASKADRIKSAAATATFTKKGANRQLQRAANQQAKMAAGKKKVTKALLKVQGVNVNQLKFDKKGDANAKMDKGQKLAVAAVGAYAAINVAAVVAARR